MSDNPAEVLRTIAEGMVDGKAIKGVDHESFDRAALDLSKIVPLTESEADAYFNAPSAREEYDKAMQFLSETYEGQHYAITRYVALLRQRLSEAREAQYRAESRLTSIRDNY